MITKFEKFNEGHFVFYPPEGGWEEKGNPKFGTVMKSELDGNWSAEYNLDDDIKKIKNDYKTLGRKKITDKVNTIINKLDKKVYDNLAKDIKVKYHVNLPSYIAVSKKEYWNKNYSNVSTLILTLHALSNGLNTEKDKMKKQIINLQSKLDELEKI